MRTLRSSSAFDLIDRIEQQLSQQLQSAERVPAAEVHETVDAYLVIVELPGVAKDAIDVKATDRTLVISAERRRSEQAEASPTSWPVNFATAPGAVAFDSPRRLSASSLWPATAMVC